MTPFQALQDVSIKKIRFSDTIIDFGIPYGPQKLYNLLDSFFNREFKDVL